MEQKKKKINTTPSSKMVSFRMPIAYIEMMQDLADATGKSKSEVLRSGLDALQSLQNAQGGRQDEV